MDTATADLVISAREAIDRHAWREALDLLSQYREVTLKGVAKSVAVVAINWR